MTNLTLENYYDKGTGALTCSKVKDYAICPNLFYHKHITGDQPESQSDAFLIGSIVDEVLTSDIDIYSKYEVVSTRTAGAKADATERGTILVLGSQMELALRMAEAVEETKAWKHIKEHGIFQDILQIDCKINKHFNSLAGRPDVWWKDGSIGYIVDLKTAVSSNHRQFFYRAIDFKYDWQQANYRYLLKLANPEVKQWRCYNIVVSKDDINTVNLFEYPDEMLDYAEKQFFITVDKIKKDKEYKKHNPTFDNPISFGDWEKEKLDNMIDDLIEEE